MLTDIEINLLKEQTKRSIRIFWVDADQVAHQVLGVQLKWVEHKDEPELAEPVARLKGGKVVALLNVEMSEFVVLQPLHLVRGDIATKYVDRVIEALELLCLGNTPPREMVEAWFRDDSEELASWAINKTAVRWATGIGVIEAAMALADAPEEGISINNADEHQTRDEAYPSTYTL